MPEIRNALSQALADGIYLKLDASNDPITENLQLENIGIAGSAPTDVHMLIGQRVYTNEAVTVVGLGCFPEFSPTASAANVIVSVQGNTWFGTTNWDVDSYVRCLDFFPAPTGSGVGSANLSCIGINTGGLLNIVGRTVTLDEANAIIAVPVAHLDFGFPFTDNTSLNIARGVWIYPACTTLGTWGRLTGIEVAKSVSGVKNQGIWISDDGIGADICFGAGSGVNHDAAIYYDGSNFIIDPDLLGTGRVYIGATGDDDLLLNGIEIDGDLNHDGSNIGFFGTAPTTKQTALTSALTQITHTGPTTPDYAIATPINVSAWGFSTQDEFETAMSVILNLQTRVDQLETKLQNYGLLA